MVSDSADGLIAVNTTTARPANLRSHHASQAGGLSGQPLFATALETTRRLRRLIGGHATLIAVGGIGSPEDARAVFDAGADLAQVYTALVYQGPSLARTLARTQGQYPSRARPRTSDS